MSFNSIAEIYDENARVRSELLALVRDLSDEAAAAVPEGEKWSIANIVEHLQITEHGMGRLCARLLEKAEANGEMSGGSVSVSDPMLSRARVADIKVEAPDMVQPTGERTISESVEWMAKSREFVDSLKNKFEQFDCTRHTFPHPFFGKLSAAEWLALIGAHETRHISQIRAILEKRDA